MQSFPMILLRKTNHVLQGSRPMFLPSNCGLIRCYVLILGFGFECSTGAVSDFPLFPFSIGLGLGTS